MSELDALDWAIVAAYALLTLGLGIWVQRRGAGEDTERYFLSARTLPWWLAGASMAASAFSIDTPLYVANLTQRQGIAANWEWWFMGASGVLGASVMARLWRRAGITTDLELITLRYGGRAAHLLRGFRAVFFALLINCLGMAAVLAAVFKVVGVALPDLVDPVTSAPHASGVLLIGGLIAVTVAYSVLSGFMGVVLTDLLQFAVSLAGALILAGVCVWRCGGLGAMAAHPAVAPKLDFLPEFSGEWGGWQGLPTRFCVFMGVSWWTYVNADGGGKYIQRLAACRDEREAERATWFSSLTFIALRSWPWIVTGLAALILLPDAQDPENNYPRLVMSLGSGVRGLVFASLLAAFMSTIDTQLNWGASYLVNDLIRPYLLPGRSERFYVQAARLCAVPMLLIAALLLVLQLQPGADGKSSVLKVTYFLRKVLEVSSGLGAVYLLRWFWWRLTAWGEVAAMVVAPLTAFACAGVTLPALLVRVGLLPAGHEGAAPYALTTLVVTGATLSTAIAASLLGPREQEAHLAAFAARVRPTGWWGPHRRVRTEGEDLPPGAWIGVRFLAGLAILYGATFVLGGLLLRPEVGVLLPWGALLAGGLALDRWARGRLAPVTASSAPGPAPAGEGDAAPAPDGGA